MNNRYLRSIITATVRSQQHYLFGVAFFRVRSRAVAEDIVQEAFLRLWEKGPLLDPAGDVKIYLYRIVVNLCNDHLRHPAAMPLYEQSAVDVADTAEDDAALLAECERVGTLLAALPSPQREVIQMHIHDSLSFAEISRLTAIPESTLKSRYNAALTTLKTLLR